MKKKITGQSQKGQDVPDMSEDAARAHLESLLWPKGPVCPHCKSGNVYRMEGATVRAGLLRCRECEKQFTVTVGTIFEDSHLPLAKWVKAFHLMTSSKKGVSALQLQRNLGLGSYRTAWFMAHRIRLAMKCEPLAGELKGIVEADEAYIGGKPRKWGGYRKPGRGTSKPPVVVLVERGGNAVSMHMPHVTRDNLKEFITKNVDPKAAIHTDESNLYQGIGKSFEGGHHTVNHSNMRFAVNGVTSNTAESYFSLLKRGVYGTFHHLSKTHLHRYCDEFSFRWNGRTLSDVDRRTLALIQTGGKRLFYTTPKSAKISPDGENQSVNQLT
jgi:transposase-like protein